MQQCYAIAVVCRFYDGNGEGGIRTLDTLLGYGALAKRCFQPLSHLTNKLAEYGEEMPIANIELRRMLAIYPSCQLPLNKCGRKYPRLKMQTSELPAKTQYTRSGDLHIAYQVVGQGPLDLVYVPGWISHVELAWEEPTLARFLRRLASFSRLMMFDKRGTGLSDRVPNDKLPTLEERIDDLRAVMDAIGSERAAVFGFSEGGNLSALFAATYPERTTALVMLGTFAKRIWSPDYPWAPKPEDREREYEVVEDEWGELMDLEHYIPSKAVTTPSRAGWLHTSAGLRVQALPSRSCG